MSDPAVASHKAPDAYPLGTCSLWNYKEKNNVCPTEAMWKSLDKTEIQVDKTEIQVCGLRV